MQTTTEPWRILRWPSHSLAYREELAPGVVLTLMRIPAGHFSMGSPAEQEGRWGLEGPQHEVKLGEFLLGQTPVTQAQWRAVAEWTAGEGEDWGPLLEATPSEFEVTPEQHRRLTD